MKKTTLLAVVFFSHGIAYGANNVNQGHLAEQLAHNQLVEDMQNNITPAQKAGFVQRLLQNANNNLPQNPNGNQQPNQQLNVQFGANQLGAAPAFDDLAVGEVNEFPAPLPE